jgi:2-oxo-4-hydroxy-4-carboxy--5-ureidoimidazoline (OHCU) decarboxylase
MAKKNKATSEAVQYQAKWLVKNHPKIAGKLVEDLLSEAERRKEDAPRTGSGYRLLSDLLKSEIDSSKMSPLDLLLFESSKKPEKVTVSLEKTEDCDSYLNGIDLTEANEATRANTRFFETLKKEMASRVQAMYNIACTATSIDKVKRQPEVLTIEGRRVVLVHSVNICLFEKREFRHDYTADEIAVKNDHPDLVERMIRSRGETARVKSGKPVYYVKALTYKEGMLFRGYFREIGQSDDVRGAEVYYVARDGKIEPLTRAEYYSLFRKAQEDGGLSEPLH